MLKIGLRGAISRDLTSNFLKTFSYVTRQPMAVNNCMNDKK